MPARRRQRSGGLVGVIWVGLLAGLLAAGCTGPPSARQQSAARPRSPAATRIAVPAVPGDVDVRAENARAGYPGWRITSPGRAFSARTSTPPGPAGTATCAAAPGRGGAPGWGRAGDGLVHPAASTPASSPAPVSATRPPDHCRRCAGMTIVHPRPMS